MTSTTSRKTPPKSPPVFGFNSIFEKIERNFNMGSYDNALCKSLKTGDSNEIGQIFIKNTTVDGLTPIRPRRVRQKETLEKSQSRRNFKDTQMGKCLDSLQRLAKGDNLNDPRDAELARLRQENEQLKLDKSILKRMVMRKKVEKKQKPEPMPTVVHDTDSGKKYQLV
jgi:hypothetical protein